jgi:hypothetical protein
MIDLRLLHDATLMKVNALDKQHFIAELWCSVTHNDNCELCLEMCIQFKSKQMVAKMQQNLA